jgi:hypothetical protein
MKKGNLRTIVKIENRYSILNVGKKDWAMTSAAVSVTMQSSSCTPGNADTRPFDGEQRPALLLRPLLDTPLERASLATLPASPPPPPVDSNHAWGYAMWLLSQEVPGIALGLTGLDGWTSYLAVLDLADLTGHLI